MADADDQDLEWVGLIPGFPGNLGLSRPGSELLFRFLREGEALIFFTGEDLSKLLKYYVQVSP